MEGLLVREQANFNHKRMNINATNGWKLIYIAATDERDDLFEAGSNAQKHLTKGHHYTVNKIFTCCSFTFVELGEFPGLFFYSIDFIDG